MPPQRPYCKDTEGTRHRSSAPLCSPGGPAALRLRLCKRTRGGRRLGEPAQTGVERATQGSIDPCVRDGSHGSPSNARPHAANEPRDRRRGGMEPGSAKRRAGRLEPGPAWDADLAQGYRHPIAPRPPGEATVDFGMDPRVDHAPEQVAGRRPARKQRTGGGLLGGPPVHLTCDQPDAGGGHLADVEVDARPTQPAPRRRQDPLHALACDGEPRHAPKPDQASPPKNGGDRPRKATPQPLPQSRRGRACPHDGSGMETNLDQSDDHAADKEQGPGQPERPRLPARGLNERPFGGPDREPLGQLRGRSESGATPPNVGLPSKRYFASIQICESLR